MQKVNTGQGRVPHTSGISQLVSNDQHPNLHGVAPTIWLRAGLHPIEVVARRLCKGTQKETHDHPDLVIVTEPHMLSKDLRSRYKLLGLGVRMDG